MLVIQFDTNAENGFKPALEAWQAAMTGSLNGAANWPAVQQ
ncbi:MAG: hypothetical protein P4L96_20330 [Rhodoferax sp.]|nr:hypothetical protein [Rhodoferax sp.]